ncbi:hypothetical protein EC973_007469 [Apophysomyces ossiformis]|uniref:MI domain-containing protein n=1 Tax=Apophysomyces ossiformis TaxID=679940 RepID=A0A8H7BTW3_9FUNG|nr:hypothetical protein EC973_007469 [Apophysomyces ossiformis]
MNRTPNTNEKTNAKSTTQPVFNYAQAAKKSSQNLDTQSQKSKTGSSTSASNINTSHNTSTSVTAHESINASSKASSNGNSRLNGSQSPEPNSSKATSSTSFAAALAKNAQSNLYPFVLSVLKTTSRQNSSQSSAAPAAKTGKNASVQLPRAPPADAASIQFGSINQPEDVSVKEASVSADNAAPVPNAAEVVFGSLGPTEASPEALEGRDSAAAAGGQPQSPSQPSQAGQGGRTHGHGAAKSPNIQSNQASFAPHHQKKPASPHMVSPSSPSMNDQNTPMAHSWTNSIPGQYYPSQGYKSQYYAPPYQLSMPPYVASSQTFVAQPRGSKAIPIINPETRAPVIAEDVASSTSSSTSNSKDSKRDDKKEKEVKHTASPSPSRAIPIVDPAIREREEREKREKEEEAERQAKEEAERKEREEAERKAKEEAEQKAKEEAERKAKEEAERKAKEEAEQKAREEAELKAKEEAEQKAKEEAERKAKEEAEQKAKEEAERKAKEEAEQKAKEEAEKGLATEQVAKPSSEASVAAEKDGQTEEQRVAAIATEKAGKAPGRLDMSAIPAHVFDEQVSSPRPLKPAPTPKRKIADLSKVKYPPDAKVPKVGKDPVSGKIQYDRDFLLQFQSLCLECSEDLSAFQNVGDEQNDRGSRGGMQRRQTSERGRPRTPGSPMEMGMFKHGSRESRMEMGKFMGGRPISHRSGSGSHGLPSPGSPGGMQREGSHGGRSRSGRGGKGRHPPREQQGGPTIPLDQVVPLEKGENRWVPTTLSSQPQAALETDLIPQDVIIRKVKALLNKLTLEKFDSISDQIWEYAHQSAKEEDGQSLKTVIQLIFEKACDEAQFAPMWARLCRKMYDHMYEKDDIKDVNIKDSKGNVVSGFSLFRKYLLNRCQQDFERGWKTRIPELDESNPDVMLSDEYYAAVKAKRQGLGLVQLIGELFKLSMLTDRIMIECLTRLCSKPSEAEDEETETMCKMLTTIGKELDSSNRRNKEWLDTYFERMKEMLNSSTLSSRVKFMIMDVFDLRKNKWVQRRGNQPAPTTIAQIREQAQKAKNEEKETMKRSGSSRGHVSHPVSRQSSHRGAGRDIQREGSGSGSPTTTADGWSTVGTGSPTSSTRGRTNELANFGKAERSKSRSSVLGPSNSPFASLTRSGSKAGTDKKVAPSDGRASPASTMSNMFSALGGDGEETERAAPAERKKLQLLPRGSTTPAADESTAATSTEEKPKLSDEVVERRAKNTLDEYFSIRDKKELYECVKELDHPDYHVILVSKMLGVVEKKAEDVDLVCDMIKDFYEQKLVEKEAYVKALKSFMEGYEDLIIDVPQAPKYVVKILLAAGVDPSEVTPEEEEDDSGYISSFKRLNEDYKKASSTDEDFDIEKVIKRTDLRSSIGITTAVLLTTYALGRAFSKRDRIPTVPYTFPFIGSTFSYVKDPSKFVQDVTAKYGSVFRVNLFGNLVTVVGGDQAHEVFTHPNLSFLESQRKFLDFGLLLDFSNYKLPPNGLGSIILKHLIPNLSTYTPRGYCQYEEMGDELFGIQGDEPVILPDFQPYIRKLIARSSAAAFVGLDLCKDPELLSSFETVVSEVSKELFPGPFRAVFPWLNKLYMSIVYPRATAVRRHRENIRKAIEPEVRRRVAQMKHNPESTMPDDVLQYIIKTYPNELDDAYFETLSTLFVILVFVGVHTTSEATTYVVYQLMTHPEYIEELWKEQEQVLREEAEARGIVYNPQTASKDKLLCPDSYKRMVKLDSFIRESFRTRSRAFLHAHTHVGDQDIVLKSGAIIHPGEEVYINMWHVHNDKTVQKAANEDLDKFVPYRYIGLDKPASKIGDDFVTFGLGRHACPGRWFAIQQVKSVMLFLIRNYDVEAAEAVQVPGIGNNLRNPKGKIRIAKKKF